MTWEGDSTMTWDGDSTKTWDGDSTTTWDMRQCHNMRWRYNQPLYFGRDIFCEVENTG